MNVMTLLVVALAGWFVNQRTIGSNLRQIAPGGEPGPGCGGDRDGEARLASWIRATDKQKAVMFATQPSPDEAAAGFRLKPWTHSTPHFLGDTRFRAYFTAYRQKVTGLAAARPDKVHTLPFASMNDPAVIDFLFDWLGLPADSRRLELLGTTVNPSPPAD